jgi:hypothetical protein
MEEEMNNKYIGLSATEKQKRKIIEIYALKICKLWDYYSEIISEIDALHNSNKLDDSEYLKRITSVAEQTKEMLAVLFIEQFYNTGDESLFDKALTMNEKITLSIVSQINMNELNITEEYDRKMSKPLLIFYQGMFINIEDVSEPVLKKQSSELLFRDKAIVNMINQKLNRARTILDVDEVTLGQKYYDGLCMRSHYM